MRQIASPKVTFVVPCYNSTEWLHECLHSLLAQSVTNWEGVIVDDGSNDPTAVTVIVDAMQDNRLRVIRHIQNRGLSAARNTGIAAAGTGLIVFVDADDKLVPDQLERTIKVAAEHDADAVFGDFQYFGGISEIVRTKVPSSSEILLSQPLHSSGMLIKKSLLERLGGFDEAIPLRLGREDTEFYIRLFNAGANVIHIDAVLYLHRIWEKSMNRRCLREEHLPRHYMYTKHRLLYDSTKTRNPFLTKGFEIAGRTALADGKRPRAAIMAARSFRYGGSIKTLELFLQSIAPMPVSTFAKLRRYAGLLLGRLRRRTPALGSGQ